MVKVSNQVCIEGPLFWVNISEHCDVQIVRIRERGKAVHQGIAEGLNPKSVAVPCCQKLYGW